MYKGRGGKKRYRRKVLYITKIKLMLIQTTLLCKLRFLIVIPWRATEKKNTIKESRGIKNCTLGNIYLTQKNMVK